MFYDFYWHYSRTRVSLSTGETKTIFIWSREGATHCCGQKLLCGKIKRRKAWRQLRMSHLSARWRFPMLSVLWESRNTLKSSNKILICKVNNAPDNNVQLASYTHTGTHRDDDLHTHRHTLINASTMSPLVSLAHNFNPLEGCENKHKSDASCRCHWIFLFTPTGKQEKLAGVLRGSFFRIAKHTSTRHQLAYRTDDDSATARAALLVSSFFIILSRLFLCTFLPLNSRIPPTNQTKMFDEHGKITRKSLIIDTMLSMSERNNYQTT